FLQFDEDGVLSGATEIKASNKIKIRGGGGSPKISITNDVINQSAIGSNMSMELNDDGTIRFYRRANDGNGEYQRIELPKLNGVPNAETSIALKGGLLWDSANEAYLGNFNDITQGWSYVAGTPANGPIQGYTYGSCFTYCSQGLMFGNAPGDYNPIDIWFRQIYYTTGNGTYSRVNTNKGAWGNWAEYTMSSVSDERLKNILGNLNVNGALDNINRMEFKLFRFKEERDKAKQPTVRRGVISQQIRKIDKEYTKCIGGFYHLDRTPLLLDGLAAIQALSRKDIENKERISKLEKEVEEL
ncbi:tail fiber domain-containing protein, partial [Salmonella enterica subsp. enterica serovar 4,12:i:-]|nr:tail fiber domain-containing protein [Salmonella enterica subsp. enterica serovar 4,12:i:-]